MRGAGREELFSDSAGGLPCKQKMASDEAHSLLKEVSSIHARGTSIILSLESDKWEMRAATLDNLNDQEVYANAMLVLERVEDDDESVRCAAVDALIRSPTALKKYSKFVGLKLQNTNRQIQLLALELLLALDGGELFQFVPKVKTLEADKDGSIRAAAKRVRLRAEEFQREVEAVAADKAARKEQKELKKQREQAAQAAKASRPGGRPAGAYRIGGHAVPSEAFVDAGAADWGAGQGSGSAPGMATRTCGTTGVPEPRATRGPGLGLGLARAPPSSSASGSGPVRSATSSYRENIRRL